MPGQTIGTQAPVVSTAASNTYPKGQCTWWACQRYHDLTGFYLPWKANASGWASAANGAQGWNVSSIPPASVPSIIVLQPGVQLADPTYGHVGVVERINADGSVYTSDQNWAGVTYPNTNYVTFRPGPGVSFVYAGGGSLLPPGPTPSPGNGSGYLPVSYMQSSATYTPLLSQVHETLINTPGFYGIALALDEAEQLPGYINLANNPNAFGVPDVPGLIRSIGATFTDNAVPVLFRSGTFLLGFLLLVGLVIKAGGPLLESGTAQLIPIITA